MARMTSTAELELGGLMQVIIAPDLAHRNRGPTYLRRVLGPSLIQK